MGGTPLDADGTQTDEGGYSLAEGWNSDGRNSDGWDSDGVTTVINNSRGGSGGIARFNKIPIARLVAKNLGQNFTY